MLWAQFFHPKNEAEATEFFVGVMLAGIMCGGIAFCTGVVMKQVTLGVIGGLVSALSGAWAGCCLGVPVALMFTVLIVFAAQSAARSRPKPLFPGPLPSDYDDLARPFQIPPPNKTGDPIPWATDCPDGPEDDLLRRAEQDGQSGDVGGSWRRPGHAPDTSSGL